MLAQKLKALKSNSRKLNEKVFGNVAKQKKEMEGFRELDLIGEEGSLSEDEKLKEKVFYRVGEEYSS